METIAPLVFTFLATVLVYFCKPYWAVRRVPGPPTTPMLGHLPLLAKFGPEVFTNLATRYGPIFRFHMGRQPLVIIADPELCREAGIKKFKDMPNRSNITPFSTPIRTMGLFMSRDAQWTTMRNTITSLYQPTHVSGQLPAIKSILDLLITNLSNSEGQEVNFSKLSLNMTTDMIGQYAFGLDFGLSSCANQHGDDLGSIFLHTVSTLKMDLSGSLSMILGIMFPILQNPVHQILKRIPWNADWRLDQTDQKIARLVDEIVTNRSNDRGGQKQHSKDFLTLILNARDSQKATRDFFTSDYISALTYEHLVAGSASGSFALTSTVYLVSGHPQVERKLLREIDDFGPPDVTPTADDLQFKLPYLSQVLKEAMRIYHASPLVSRETNKDVELGGYFLPKGTWVWLALGALAKDPKQFPEPEEFRPERFDPECDEEKRRHPCATSPFGIGPRACLGVKYALQIQKLSLFHLYQKFIFRHSPSMEKPLALEYGIALGFKNDVMLKVIKRTSHNG